MKQKFIWGTVVLFSLVAVAAFFGYLWAKDIPLTSLVTLPGASQNTRDTDVIQVVSWKPKQATLTYTKSGQIYTLQIMPLDPAVIVPIFENGEFVREELALVPQSPHWLTAFCPEDTLELEATTSGKIISIRNQGPRPCAQ